MTHYSGTVTLGGVTHYSGTVTLGGVTHYSGTVTLRGVTHYSGTVTLGGVTHYIRRAATALLLMLLTTMTAGANEPVKYIDDNGEEQEVTEYTALTGSETQNSSGEIELTEGTYVVNSNNLTYQHAIVLTGNTTLILADGANMTVEPTEENFGIKYYTGDASLTIYGQKNQTGTLTVSGNGGYCLNVKKIRHFIYADSKKRYKVT